VPPSNTSIFGGDFHGSSLFPYANNGPGMTVTNSNPFIVAGTRNFQVNNLFGTPDRQFLKNKEEDDDSLFTMYSTRKGKNDK
jgi:hypothetical protein